MRQPDQGQVDVNDDDGNKVNGKGELTSASMPFVDCSWGKVEVNRICRTHLPKNVAG
jgi:hypothetical protein